MRWSEISKPTRRVKSGKTLTQRAAELEASRNASRNDYAEFMRSASNRIPENFTGVESDPAADWLDKHYPGWTHEDWLSVNYLGQPPVEAE